jgi:methylated-DNA-[protein]-cysteine S-methyltransferase
MRRIQTSKIASARVATPIGLLMVAASPRGVIRIDFAARPAARRQRPAARANTPEARQAQQHLVAAVRQLREYFAGRRSSFDLSLDLAGTPYQRRVWSALRGIRFGRTVSYGELAAQIGAPHGARAVGRACATNPAPVVVPCHRVVGGDGSLHGYDGGLWRKQRLLELESARR